MLLLNHTSGWCVGGGGGCHGSLDTVVRVAGSLDDASANPRAAFGIVAWIDEGRRIFEFQATTDPGNSGGPVVDADNFCVYGLVSFALRGSVGVTYYASDVEAIKAILKQAGIEYLERAATGSSIDLDFESRDRSRVYAIAAAGIGGLLLGALIFSGRKRIFAIALPLLLAVVANVAHAKVVKVDMYAVNVPDNVKPVHCTVGRGFVVVSGPEYCWYCPAVGYPPPGCFCGGSHYIWVYVRKLGGSGEGVVGVFEDYTPWIPAEQASEFYRALKGLQPLGGKAKQHLRAAWSFEGETWRLIPTRPGRHGVAVWVGLDWSGEWLVCVGLAHGKPNPTTTTPKPISTATITVKRESTDNSSTKAAAIAAGLGIAALAGLALALTRR